MTATEMRIFLITLIIMLAIVSLFLPLYIHCKKEEKKEQSNSEKKEKINEMTKEKATNYLLVHLNNYHIETFINIFFQLLENDHSMSQDDRFSVKDTILFFLYQNRIYFGTEIKRFDYDNITTAFIVMKCALFIINRPFILINVKNYLGCEILQDWDIKLLYCFYTE